MDWHHARRASLGILVAVAVGACSGSAAPLTAAAPSAPQIGPSIASFAPSAAPASPSPAPSREPAASPAAVASHKPLPSIDPAELDAYLTSSITLLDLTDGALSVSVTYIDPSTSDPIDFGTYDLGATEQLTDQVPPGTYKLRFHLPDDTSVATCTIDVGDKDTYAFAAIPGAVAVSKGGSKPTTADELFVSTSSLCGH